MFVGIGYYWHVVVHVGDFLEMATASALKSPVHKVDPPDRGSERHSLVTFVYPGYDTRLGLGAGAVAASAAGVSALERPRVAAR